MSSATVINLLDHVNESGHHATTESPSSKNKNTHHLQPHKDEDIEDNSSSPVKTNCSGCCSSEISPKKQSSEIESPGDAGDVLSESDRVNVHNVGCSSSGPSGLIPLESDQSKDRVGCYLKSLPAKYSPVALLNLLFANDLLLQNKEYLDAIDEALVNDKYPISDLAETETTEKYERRVQLWNDRLCAIAEKINKKQQRKMKNKRNLGEYETYAMPNDGKSSPDGPEISSTQQSCIQQKGKQLDLALIKENILTNTDTKSSVADSIAITSTTTAAARSTTKSQTTDATDSPLMSVDDDDRDRRVSDVQQDLKTVDSNTPSVRGCCLVQGPWSRMLQFNDAKTVPTLLIKEYPHPIVRRTLSFFVLCRPLPPDYSSIESGDNKTSQSDFYRKKRNSHINFGYCFCCFRSRKLLNLFAKIMGNGVQYTPCSKKQLKIGLSRYRDLPENKSYYENIETTGDENDNNQELLDINKNKMLALNDSQNEQVPASHDSDHNVASNCAEGQDQAESKTQKQDQVKIIPNPKKNYIFWFNKKLEDLEKAYVASKYDWLNSGPDINTENSNFDINKSNSYIDNNGRFHSYGLKQLNRSKGRFGVGSKYQINKNRKNQGDSIDYVRKSTDEYGVNHNSYSQSANGLRYNVDNRTTESVSSYNNHIEDTKKIQIQERQDQHLNQKHINSQVHLNDQHAYHVTGQQKIDQRFDVDKHSRWYNDNKYQHSQHNHQQKTQMKSNTNSFQSPGPQESFYQPSPGADDRIASTNMYGLDTNPTTSQFSNNKNHININVTNVRTSTSEFQNYSNQDLHQNSINPERKYQQHHIYESEPERLLYDRNNSEKHVDRFNNVIYTDNNINQDSDLKYYPNRDTYDRSSNYNSRNIPCGNFERSLNDLNKHDERYQENSNHQYRYDDHGLSHCRQTNNHYQPRHDAYHSENKNENYNINNLNNFQDPRENRRQIESDNRNTCYRQMNEGAQFRQDHDSYRLGDTPFAGHDNRYQPQARQTYHHRPTTENTRDINTVESSQYIQDYRYELSKFGYTTDYRDERILNYHHQIPTHHQPQSNDNFRSDIVARRRLETDQNDVVERRNQHGTILYDKNSSIHYLNDNFMESDNMNHNFHKTQTSYQGREYNDNDNKFRIYSPGPSHPHHQGPNQGPPNRPPGLAESDGKIVNSDDVTVNAFLDVFKTKEGRKTVISLLQRIVEFGTSTNSSSSE